jgi:aspartate-semialdehyde dehydrogenase
VLLFLRTNPSLEQASKKSSTTTQNEYAGVQEMAYKYPIHRNAIPQCDSFEDNGYTKEEMKLVRETKKY